MFLIKKYMEKKIIKINDIIPGLTVENNLGKASPDTMVWNFM
jgi:hypothetical protein